MGIGYTANSKRTTYYLVGYGLSGLMSKGVGEEGVDEEPIKIG